MDFMHQIKFTFILSLSKGAKKACLTSEIPLSSRGELGTGSAQGDLAFDFHKFQHNSEK
jgi:hypothetical protein